jgi:phosphoribosylformylglycinamidine cyclo-ligase
LAGVKEHARSTLGVEGAGAPIGHFGGVYLLPAGPDRLLVASADGVGTKLKLAFVIGGDAHARVGADLVNHCVNDLLACGARPLFFLDYVAMGTLDGDVLDRLIGGMAAACRENGLALIGGETAEMPGLYASGEYDAAGFIVGTVDPGRLIDGRAVSEGDLLVGLPSEGLHTNGYSLARRILGLTGDLRHDRERLKAPLPGGGESIGDALMRRHPSYFRQVFPLVEQGLIRGMAHITGGGLLDNIPRMLPDDLAAELDPTTWTPHPVFTYLVERGAVPPSEQYRALNMGIGFVVALSPADVVATVSDLPEARNIGRVIAREGADRPRVRGLFDADGAD